MSKLKNFDTLDLEFKYYSSLVKDLFCLLPNKCQKIVAGAWFCKLTEPMYNADPIREKRNRYLLMFIICLTLGELKYPFDRCPPAGILKELSSIKNPYHSELCSSQLIKNQKSKVKSCDLHENNCPCDVENIGKVLDRQFEFLSNLSAANINLLSDPSDRRRGRQWIKFLNSIESQCFHMKGVRNDYAMLLAGYVSNDELPGPFIQLPIERVVPLEDLVNTVDMNNHMMIGPHHPLAIPFLKDLPDIKEGAFAFLGITGQMCNTSVKKT